jgi:hypothetical protein
MERKALAARSQVSLIGFATIVAVSLIAVHSDAAVKARVEYDKTFDFTRVKTWAWNAERAGQIVLARTQNEDVETVRQRAEPVIFDAVKAEMPRRGLTATTGPSDVTLMYYLLLTVGASGHTLGQFLPAVTGWGLPPLPPAATSIEVIEQGSLVLDLSANGRVVWRGVGEAKIKLEMPQEERAELLREGVRDLLRRYPPKS